MPIYEYRCAGCGRKASIFFRSIASADADPACPHCGEHRLTRLVSRVWSRRSSSDDAFTEPTFDDGDVPFYGADPFAESFEVGDDARGIDGSLGEDNSGEDVATMAREARMMAQMMGEPLDAGFDAALRHVEQGADPDDVFGELDAVDKVQEPSSNEPQE